VQPLTVIVPKLAMAPPASMAVLPDTKTLPLMTELPSVPSIFD